MVAAPKHRAHDALPEVVAREHRVERHHAAVGEAEYRGHDIEILEARRRRRKLPAASAWINEPGDQHPLYALAVGEEAQSSGRRAPPNLRRCRP